ncbi:MAG: hypothetical protein LBB89_06380 [Treponema sp.]|jgi:uncharacterized membrane protein YcgQ (UPF0703/DUF1980 family)|nr:hypothetical protein [Treponema sp.]
MRKDNSARNSLIIALVTLAVTVSLFSFNYVRAKQKIENLNAVLGKSAELNFSPTAQDFFGNQKPETIEEKTRYASLSPNKGLVEIKEKMFLAQVNDVYLNPADYLGKTIKLEGIFKEEQGYEKSYCFVIRYGPGCCGNDGNAGFEVAWAKEDAQPYPANDSWVEAAGVLKSYEEDGYSQYLYLDLAALNVLSKRGAETVLQ